MSGSPLSDRKPNVEDPSEDPTEDVNLLQTVPEGKILEIIPKPGRTIFKHVFYVQLKSWGVTLWSILQSTIRPLH